MSKVPNFLTISRIILLPLLAFFIINDSQFNALWSIFLFFLISATDFFDGYIARKLNTSSNLGKMLDPIADKLFVTVMIIIFIYTRDIGGYSVIAGTLIISREIFISGLREYAASSNANILEVSKSYGDILIVGVNSDDSIKKLKGPTRPKISQKDRLRILSSIKYVDYVLLFEEETPLKLIEKIKPNFLIKGGDYSLEDIVGAEFVENNGGQVKIVKLLEGHSSSSLIDKLEN